MRKCSGTMGRWSHSPKLRMRCSLFLWEQPASPRIAYAKKKAFSPQTGDESNPYSSAFLVRTKQVAAPRSSKHATSKQYAWTARYDQSENSRGPSHPNNRYQQPCAKGESLPRRRFYLPLRCSYTRDTEPESQRVKCS